MPKITLVLTLALLLSLGSGCAKLIRLEIPDEFKKKKLKEDPPISMILPAPPRGAEMEA
jgi:hypothetical protein